MTVPSPGSLSLPLLSICLEILFWAFGGSIHLLEQEYKGETILTSWHYEVMGGKVQYLREKEESQQELKGLMKSCC